MRRCAWLLVLVCVPSSAWAHAIGLSRGTYRVTGECVEAELTFARPELLRALPSLDANTDGALSAAELAAGAARLEQAIVAPLEVRGSGACPGALREARLADQDGVVLSARYQCAPAPSGVSLRFGFLGRLSDGHRHLASVTAGATVQRALAYEGSPEIVLVVSPAASEAATSRGLFRLGILHILTGYDHLVFLLGLILVGGRVRSLALVVTAFTLAHSVTLGLSVLGAWAPSPRLVEPAIALSIAYVGIENWFVSDASRRWRITFPFGLVHGFGFAGALREIALPARELPLALVSFNAGVEAGQLAVLLITLPALAWLRGRDWFASRGIRAASSAIAVAGLAWFVARILGS